MRTQIAFRGTNFVRWRLTERSPGYSSFAVSRLIAYFLTMLLLFQTMGQELLVLDYAMNKAEITQRYCVNKDRPQLHCDGKCYLASKLRRSAKRESKAPNSAPVKIKFEALMPLRLVPPAPVADFPALVRYARPAPTHYQGAPLTGIFHPPSFRS